MSTTSVLPASTTVFGHVFSNLGPLTTTFTAPSSCATVNTDEVFFVHQKRPPFIAGKPVCRDNYWTKGDCIPSGKQIDDQAEVDGNASGSMERAEWNNGEFLYHSPGIACPQGWNTVGLIAKDNGTMTMSGFMTEWPKQWGKEDGPDETWVLDLKPTAIWGEFLGPSQTVAFCGPSGYDINPEGLAFSTLGAYVNLEYSTWCEESWAGKPLEEPKTILSVSNSDIPPHLSYVNPGPHSWKSTILKPTGTFGTISLETIDVVTRQELIAMVYEASDMKNAPTNTGAAAGSETTGSQVEEVSSAATVSESGATMLSTRTLVPVLTVLAGMFAGSLF